MRDDSATAELPDLERKALYRIGDLRHRAARSCSTASARCIPDTIAFTTSPMFTAAPTASSPASGARSRSAMTAPRWYSTARAFGAVARSCRATWPGTDALARLEAGGEADGSHGRRHRGEHRVASTAGSRAAAPEGGPEADHQPRGAGALPARMARRGQREQEEGRGRHSWPQGFEAAKLHLQGPAPRQGAGERSQAALLHRRPALRDHRREGQRNGLQPQTTRQRGRLRTSDRDIETVLRTWITDIEATFRSLKSEPGLRPASASPPTC